MPEVTKRGTSTNMSVVLTQKQNVGLEETVGKIVQLAIFE